jgi:flagellin-like hook-associated protein FlgL
MMQSAEGSMSEVSDILQRMKELSVQGRNESLDSVQRSFIAAELKQLKDEINSIAERTTFNGMSLLKNALRTQISQASTAGMLSEGAAVLDGVSTRNVKSTNATVGNYSISWRSETSTDLSADRVSAAVPVTNPGKATERTVTINAGDVYEGAQISITIEGSDDTRTYSVAVGQDDTVDSVVSNLKDKLIKYYSQEGVVTTDDSGLSPEIDGDDQIIFSGAAQLGIAKITVNAKSLQATNTVAATASSVDAPLNADDGPRTITIDSADVIEGRKFTVSVGNANAVSTFSTYVGAGMTAEDVATNLQQLIDDVFDDVEVNDTNESDTIATIDFLQDGGYGMAKIELKIEDTIARSTGLTLSEVNSTFGVETARTVTVGLSDLAEGNVISVTVNGKEYAYRVSQADAQNSEEVDPTSTANSVARQLRSLMSADMNTEGGMVASDVVELDGVDAGDGATEEATVTFSDINIGDSVTIGGLTFTASKNLTAAEVAAKFADLDDGSTGDEADTDGSYSGALTGWTSDPVAGDEVEFTAVTSGNVSNLQTSATYSADTTAVTTGDLDALESNIVWQDSTGLDDPIDDDKENAVISFNTATLTNGRSIVFAGLTIEYTDDDPGNAPDAPTATELAAALVKDVNSQNAGEFYNNYKFTTADGVITINGTLAYDLDDRTTPGNGSLNPGQLRATSSEYGNVTNIAYDSSFESAGAIANDIVVVSVYDEGTAYATRTLDLRTLALNAGDQLTIDGVTFTAKKAASAADINDALVAFQENSNDESVFLSWDNGGFDNFTLVNDDDHGLLTFVHQEPDDSDSLNASVTSRVANTDPEVETVDGDSAHNTSTATFAGWGVGEESTDLAMFAGDSVTVGGLRFTATNRISYEQLAEAFANLHDGATYGAGNAYGYYEGTLRGWRSGELNDVNGEIMFTQTADAALVSDDSLTASVKQKKAELEIGTDENNNLLSFTTDAKLGRADISYKVLQVTGAGQVTVTADAATTGFANKSQTIAVNTVAAGGFQRMNFDQLGISFDLVNDRATAINADSFATYKAGVSAVSVQADGKSEALFQTGANIRDTLVIDGFKDIRVFAGNTNSGDENLVFTELAESMANLDSDVSQSSFAAVQTDVEAMIERISQYRSYFGAQQNRVDYAIANLQSQSENITEANSRIRDTDYAAETANLTKTQIMQQAATAMLAQANQMPNVILALLK